MNYKYFYILIFLILTNCASQNFSTKKNPDPIIFTKYSNQGFALIYTDELFKNKTINKKLNDRDLFVFQKNLKKDTTVKITNQRNNKSVIATVKSKSIYPNFYLQKE